VKRRELLKQTGWVLAALGLSETAGWAWASRYQQALAQPARRKLALLIGIDQYPNSVLGAAGQKAALRGCVTDVELQRELLIHRFGFLPADILVLTNAQATQQGMLEAIRGHLCDQAQPGDAVVLHFSGYGSQIRLAGAQAPIASWVPVDGRAPTDAAPSFKDLPESGLKQVLQSLKTKQLTTVLDAGFSDAEAQLSASYRDRSRGVVPMGTAVVMPAEFASGGAEAGPPTGPVFFPGTLLRAARPEQWALERVWDGFSAGVFTYALTRYLWNATPAITLQVVLGRAREAALQWGVEQSPQLAGKRQTEAETVYDTPLLPATQADAVVTAVASDQRTAELWLGGLPAGVVQYGSQSWVTVVDAQGNRGPAVPLRSHSGLTAKILWPGDSKAAWSVGQPVQEAIRVIPRSIHLVVALDHSLERIERVDATSALAALPFVNSTGTAEQPADCLFGKTLTPPAATLTANVSADVSPPAEPATQRYGIFSPTRVLIPGTFSKQDEAIKAAVSRLAPKLQTLLAVKWLRLTENQASSQLAVRLNLEMVAPQEKLVLQRETLRSGILPSSRATTLMATQGFPSNIPAGSRVHYRLLNFEPVPLYFMLFSLDAQERLSVFWPTLPGMTEPFLTAAQASFTLPPGASCVIPESGFDWDVGRPQGSVETYAVCSTIPPVRTLKQLMPLVGRSNNQRISLTAEALPVIQALLEDLHSGNVQTETTSLGDTYAFNVATWATLGFTYEAT
jgi:hypothetical protein